MSNAVDMNRLLDLAEPLLEESGVSPTDFTSDMSRWLTHRAGVSVTRVFQDIVDQYVLEPDFKGAAAYFKQLLLLDTTMENRDRWWSLPDKAKLVIFGSGDRHICNDATFLALVETKDFAHFLCGIYPPRQHDVGANNNPVLLDSAIVNEKSWHAKYTGEAHERLLTAIKAAMAQPVPRVYANSMAIIQSSGTGKSRTVDEMAKRIFTLPFNLRPDKGDDGAAYPPPDKGVREHFRMIPQALRSHVSAHFLVFFAALFRTVKDELVELKPKETGGDSDLPLYWRWYKFLETGRNREELYRRTINSMEHMRQKVNQNVSANQMELLNSASQIAKIEARALLSAISHDVEDTLPAIVMYFDESHTLFDHLTSDKNKNGKPVATYYDALLAALDVLDDKSCRVFALFMSTNSTMARYSPPSDQMPSRRAHGANLPAPFTELSFDIHPTFPLDDASFTLTELSEPSFMCRFGRPMFWTRYDTGLANIQGAIVEFAMSKLLNFDISSTSFTPSLPSSSSSSSQLRLSQSESENSESSSRNRPRLTALELGELAALDTRLLLEFEPHRQMTQQLLVESNMRIVFSVPSHREYSVSGYPSEPILAEAAAHALAHFRKVAEADRSDSIARILLKHMDNGLISKGERGEMVARLLLMLAMDEAQERSTEGQVDNYSRPVSLATFLEALVGETEWARIMEAKPNNTPGQSFKDAFKDAKVRFTHFGRAGDTTASTSGAAYTALLRGMAIQCHATQAVIDIIVPVFFDNETSDRKVCEESTTAILISVKNRMSASTRATVAIDDADVEFFPKGSAMTNPRPYIAIVMELGVQPEKKVLAGTRKGKQPRSDPQEGAGANETEEPPRKKRETQKKGATAKKRTHKKTATQKNAPKTQMAMSQAGVFPPGISRLEIGDEVQWKSPRSDPVHPRYSFFIYGCSPRVYGVIEKEEVYANLLASRRFVQEHPRQDVQSLNAVEALKPMWQAGEPCYSWINYKPMRDPPSVRLPQVGVVIDVAPEGEGVDEARGS